MKIDTNALATIAAPWTYEIQQDGLAAIDLELQIPSLIAAGPLFGEPCSARADYSISVIRKGELASGGYVGAFVGRSEVPFTRRVRIELHDAGVGDLLRLTLSRDGDGKEIKILSITELQ